MEELRVLSNALDPQENWCFSTVSTDKWKIQILNNIKSDNVLSSARIKSNPEDDITAHKLKVTVETKTLSYK